MLSLEAAWLGIKCIGLWTNQLGFEFSGSDTYDLLCDLVHFA